MLNRGSTRRYIVNLWYFISLSQVAIHQLFFCSVRTQYIYIYIIFIYDIYLLYIGAIAVEGLWIGLSPFSMHRFLCGITWWISRGDFDKRDLWYYYESSPSTPIFVGSYFLTPFRWGAQPKCIIFNFLSLIFFQMYNFSNNIRITSFFSRSPIFRGGAIIVPSPPFNSAWVSHVASYNFPFWNLRNWL